MRGPNLVPMLKQLQMGLRAFLVLASKIWTFICFVLRKNTRAVEFCISPINFFSKNYSTKLYSQVIQHQTVKYDLSPLSPLSKHRLSMYQLIKLCPDCSATNHGITCRYGQEENIGLGFRWNFNSFTPRWCSQTDSQAGYTSWFCVKSHNR